MESNIDFWNTACIELHIHSIIHALPAAQEIEQSQSENFSLESHKTSQTDRKDIQYPKVTKIIKKTKNYHKHLKNDKKDTKTQSLHKVSTRR